MAAEVGRSGCTLRWLGVLLPCCYAAAVRSQLPSHDAAAALLLALLLPFLRRSVSVGSGRVARAAFGGSLASL